MGQGGRLLGSWQLPHCLPLLSPGLAFAGTFRGPSDLRGKLDMGAGLSDSGDWMKPVLAAVSLCSLPRQQKPLPGSGCPSGPPLVQVTSAPCSLGFQTPAQVGSSFFSFVNYFAPAPWRGLCLLGLPGCSGLAVLPPGPLPAQAGSSCRRHRAEKPRRLRNLGRREEAAGGGWRSGKGCKCEPEGEGLAAVKARPGPGLGGVWGRGWGYISMFSPTQKFKASAGK